MLARLLEHPLTRGLDIDSPETTGRRIRLIQQKPFLRRIYEEWYRCIAAELPSCRGQVLELGTGAGFMKEYIPGLVTSDVFPIPGVDLILSAEQLPFPDESLRAIVMTNVFHHFAAPRQFLDEADRCVRPGGRIVMLEPWNTAWSRLVYTRLHHESFQPDAPDWGFVGSGPLSDANGALPWIMFERDRDQFLCEYPGWQIRRVLPTMPFRYVLSGGVSLRSLMPGFGFTPWKLLEAGLQPLIGLVGMFAYITLEKRSRNS
jgi:SAM-dependent methyltransferase